MLSDKVTLIIPKWCSHITLEVPRKTNINFLRIILIYNQEKSYEYLLNYHQRENALIFYQILFTNSLRKCMEISVENLFVDIGA